MHELHWKVISNLLRYETIDHQKEDLIEQAKKRMISNIYLSISTGLQKILFQGGTVTIFNRTYNEFYTKRKPVKNGVYWYI